MGRELNKNCAIMPATFLQLLASSLMVNDAGVVLGFNVTILDAAGCNCTPYINCDTTGLPPEQVIRQAFGLDSCGKLAIKLVSCEGALSGALQ